MFPLENHTVITVSPQYTISLCNPVDVILYTLVRSFGPQLCFKMPTGPPEGIVRPKAPQEKLNDISHCYLKKANSFISQLSSGYLRLFIPPRQPLLTLGLRPRAIMIASWV